MKYQYYILSAPDDFYMADAICRELEKAGKSCYYNLRDSSKEDKMPDAYNSIGDTTSLVAVVNEEFFSNNRLVSPVSFYSKKTSTDKVFVLQNGLISEYPETWGGFRLLNATKGLNKDIINLIKGEDSLVSSAENVELSAPLLLSQPMQKSAYVSSPINMSAEQLQNQEAIQTSDEEISDTQCDIPSIFDLIVMEDGLPVTLQRAIKYFKGDGVPQDDERAYALFKKAAAENPDNVKAQYYFGLCSEFEYGGGKIEDAVAAYEKAIKLGHSEASLRLGMVKYAIGEYKDARNILSKLSSTDPTVSFGLGLIDEAEEKYEDALEHYSEAAEVGYLPAQNALGCLYAEGKGVKQNETKALQWFVMASNGGLTDAMVNAGVRLVDSDNEEFRTAGIAMLQEAAERGDETAINYMQEIEAQLMEEQEMTLEQERRNHSSNRRDDYDGSQQGNGEENPVVTILKGVNWRGLAEKAARDIFNI